MKPDECERLRRSQTHLRLDETDHPLEIERGEVEQFYEPLARRALSLRRPGGRTIVAVAGPPGSGKSAFALTLAAVINALAGEDTASAVGLDGWHYPNAYLDTHTFLRDGVSEPLRRIKGAPETYDRAAILAFLAAARRGERVAYPVYSRALHDPQPAARTLEASQRLVALEGNYWLLDEPEWRVFLPFFDLRIFLRAAPETLRAGLAARHLRGGKDRATVEAHLRAVDLPNIERVLGRALPADVVVYKADSRHISRLSDQVGA